MPQTLQSLTDTTFHELVRERMGTTLVYFTGSWCQPCKAFGPIVEKFADRNKSDLACFKADMDKANAVAIELGIRSLPSLVLFVDGMIRDTYKGTMSSEELRLWVQENS